MWFYLLYNLPLFGLACYWAYCRYRESKQLLSWVSVVDVIVIIVAASRYFGAAIPPSGHALFLTHTLITTRNLLYRVIAIALLILTIALKLSWGDFSSWSYGMLAGLMGGGAWVYANRKQVAVGSASLI